LYSRWLYNAPSLSIGDEGKVNQSLVAVGASSELWFNEVERAANAYMFGDKIFDRDFCDFAIDDLLAHVKLAKRCPIGIFFELRVASSQDAPVRMLLPDSFAYAGDEEWFVNVHYNEDAWKHIALAAIRNKGGKHIRAPWTTGETCKYHWHTKDGGACYKTKKNLMQDK
jgi:hypothetical protein